MIIEVFNCEGCPFEEFKVRLEKEGYYLTLIKQTDEKKVYKTNASLYSIVYLVTKLHTTVNISCIQFYLGGESC